MSRMEHIGTPDKRPDPFNLFPSADRDPSLTRIGFRLRDFYASRPDELVPERFVRLLDRLDRSTLPTT
jgi:hypothetical protein